jgi:hypothetical protein
VTFSKLVRLKFYTEQEIIFTSPAIQHKLEYQNVWKEAMLITTEDLRKRQETLDRNRRNFLEKYTLNNSLSEIQFRQMLVEHFALEIEAKKLNLLASPALATPSDSFSNKTVLR